MSSSQLIALSSTRGLQLLNEVASGATDGCWYQPKLHRIFAKQIGNSTCGLVSCCHVLSAFNIASDDQVTAPKFTEGNMYSYEKTNAVIALDKLRKNGMTLDEVHDLLLAHGARNVTKVNAADCSAARLRDDAVDALSRSDSSKAIIVNYHMAALGQNLPFGHHSPVAAYHAPTDRLLVLDTWPETAECWAEVGALHAAMDTVDDETGRTRGYCIVEF